MASGPSVDVAMATLDLWFGGISPTPPAAVDVRLWTVAPDFDGTGGTEGSGGGYEPCVLLVDAAVPGGVGQIAKVLSSAAVTFYDLTFASTDVLAISAHDHITGDMLWLNDAPVFGEPWIVGGSPQFAAGDYFVDIVPV